MRKLAACIVAIALSFGSAQGQNKGMVIDPEQGTYAIDILAGSIRLGPAVANCPVVQTSASGVLSCTALLPGPVGATGVTGIPGLGGAVGATGATGPAASAGRVPPNWPSFFAPALPANATTQARVMVFSGATAIKLTTNDPKLQAAGRVVGIVLVSDAARTTGTATARVRIGGVGNAFNGGSVALDAVNTTSDSDAILPASGLVIASGQTIGCEVVTVGWAPTTANVQCALTVAYD